MATSEKNTAPATWTNEDNNQYENFLQNMDEISDEDLVKFNDLVKRRQAAQVQRKDSITSIKNAISDLGISIKDLFDESSIKSIAKDFGFFGGNKPAKAPKSTKGSKAVVELGTTPLLIGSVGATNPIKYFEGKVFTQKTPWVKFPQALIHYGDSAESLLSIATPEGKKYFATAKGQKELAEILRHVEIAKGKSGATSKKAKAPAKKAVAKKAPAKKAVAKKAVAKKSPPKNASVPKVAKKKSVAKKIATKKATKP